MFNLFKRNGFSGQTPAPLNGHDGLAAPVLPDVEERVFIEPAPAPVTAPTSQFTDKSPAPVVADHNIAMLYAFLDRNHEAKGYDDALLNPDTSHLNQNLDALRNDLMRTISKVKTFYEDFMQETDYHILTRGRTGMVDMVEELEMKKKIAAGHFEKVLHIERSLNDDRGAFQGMLISYTRGFKNGLAAISHHHILTRKF
jgi:hypothetical protein